MNKFLNKVKLVLLNSVIFSNIVKATDLLIPANKIEIVNLDDHEKWETTDNSNITFTAGTFKISEIISANKHKCGDKTINTANFNTYNLIEIEIDSTVFESSKVFKNEDINGKKITIYICPNKPVTANNIEIKLGGRTLKNKTNIDNIYTREYHRSYGQMKTKNEILFLKLFKDANFADNDTNFVTMMDNDEYCVKNYTCGSTNLDFSKREPTWDERKKILDDIKNNKKVTLTVEKCKKRIDFYYKDGKDFSKVNKKYQQVLDIIEKYRSGRYDNDNITFKAIVDEIKALSIFSNSGEISIVEENNEGKEYNSDNNPFNFNATWLITLPEICYKKDIKLNVKFISDDNNFELKKIQGIINGNIEINTIEGYTLAQVKNILCSTLNLPNEFKENDGLTYKYEGNNNALNNNEVFNENKTIEIHIPNTKTNLVTKKETEDKDKKDNKSNKDNDSDDINGQNAKGISGKNCSKK